MLNGNNNNKDREAIKSKLYVKYMVCLRDQEYVQSVLNKQGLKYRLSVYGAIELLEEITEVQHHELKKGLSKSGFILLDEEESMLIDRILHTIFEIVHNSDTLPKLSFMDVINKYAISGDDSILKIFSDVKGMSVLQFIVREKIERAKELILYENKSLEEIADILHYKNRDYLIAQFKKNTGLKPSYFKRLKKERMRITDEYTTSSHSGAA